MSQILLDGYTVDEVLQLPNEELRVFVLRDEPLVFKVGSANMLGRFKVDGDALVMEPAYIDGGGEGALPSVAALASRYARRKGLTFIEWRVHAVHCANPNLKLRRVLERRGLVVRSFPGTGKCYWLRAPADAVSQAIR